DHEFLIFKLLAGEQQPDRALYVFVKCGDAGYTIRLSVSMIIEKKDIQAFSRHPCHTGDVSADVLRISVQEENSRPSPAVGRQKPSMQAGSIGALKGNVLVCESEVGRF